MVSEKLSVVYGSYPKIRLFTVGNNKNSMTNVPQINLGGISQPWCALAPAHMPLSHRSDLLFKVEWQGYM